MKNIIKITASALVVFLTLGSVAFAEPSTNGGSTGSTNSVPSTNGGSTGSSNSVPSTNGGSVGSTDGSAPSNPNEGGSDNGSSNGSSRRRSSGGTRANVSLTDTKVTVNGNKATVVWNTKPSTQGMLVYGPMSLATPTNATAFYGYAAGTTLTGANTTHSHTFTMAPNVTYFVRPVAIVGARVVFGSEVKVNATGATAKTAAPAVGTIFDAPTKPVIDSKIPADVEVSKATTSNTAAVADSGSKIGAFFKKIWNTIIAPFCR